MPSEFVQNQIQKFLVEAENSLSADDWAGLRQVAQRILTLEPGNGDGEALLAAAVRGLEQSQESRAAQSADVAVPPPAPSSPMPASFADGRYQVKSVLGEGGKKRVYLAHDELLDRDVAFALIKTEDLDDASRTRVSREAQAMGRLGSHPHIVTVFDLGEHEGQPYMVTELMGGGDVEGVIENAEDGKLSLERAISIAVETCRGLEFAHSKGIVHRDLKPGNVWLAGDGTAKIGDFGLAVATDRSRLTSEGMMVGTVSYMPPEQAMGGEVTPSADLYSLGAMLYEMVCGRPPFVGDDSVAIIGQHINTPPVAATWHRSDCPRPLEALIMRLLAKDPTERPESASDVLTALEAIDLSTPVEERSEEDAEAHALESLAGGVFVGRHREMGELKAALEDALGGRGRLITLVGEPGIGKTRTSDELATYAGLRGAQVLWGRCHESRGAPPYWPWVQAIRSYVREREPDQLRSEMGAGAADIAEIVSDVRERISDLPHTPALDDPEQARFRLFDSITAFLKSASQSKPLVVVLDNLHWADKPSLLLLEFLAQELANSRLLVIGTYRDVDLSRQHPLAETLGELTRERLFQRVLLRGLTEDDVGRFIEVTTGVSPPSGLVQAVHTQTEGNPLFVTEVVRLLVQEGELPAERAVERDSWEVRIPEGVREVIGRRLNRLSQRCNGALTIASVIGREFGLDQLRLLVEDTTEDRLLEALEEALSARVIEELPRSVGRYEFTHALIRQTLEDELTTTRRVRLHARIAEALEALYGDEAEANAVELAYHFSEAEAVLGGDKLVLYSRVAGERALANYAQEEALVHFRRALAVKEDQPADIETADILFGLGSASASTVQLEYGQQVWDILAQAFDHYMEFGEVTKAVAVATYPIPVLGAISGAADVAERALQIVPSDSNEAGQLLSRLGYTTYIEMGDYEKARQAMEDAIVIAKRTGDGVLEARTLANLASVYLIEGMVKESIEAGTEAVDLAVRLNDLQAEMRAHFWSGSAYLRTDNLEVARGHLVKVADIASKLGDRTYQALAAWALSMTSAVVGSWDEAKEIVDGGLARSPESIRLLGQKAFILLQIGEFEGFETTVGHLHAAVEGHAWLSYLLPIAAWETGRDEWLKERPVAASETGPYRVWRGFFQAMAALAAVLRNDVADAATSYEALKHQTRTLQAFIPVSIDRVLGLLANTIGNLGWDSHFDDALVFCRGAGFRPELGWSLHDYASILLDRNGLGD